MAKVTSKGQITIPVRIRQALDLEPGDELRFSLESGDLSVKVVKQTRLSDLYASVPAPRPFPGKAAIRSATAKARGERRGRRPKAGS